MQPSPNDPTTSLRQPLAGDSRSRRDFLRKLAGASLLTLTAAVDVPAADTSVEEKKFTIENGTLRVDFLAPSGALSVTDKRSGMVWKQKVTPGFRVARDSIEATTERISAQIKGEKESYAIELSFTQGQPVGEGILMPLAKPDEIGKTYSFTGGQPWWGLTDCKRAMSARLDSFVLVEGIYASPLKINYAFYADGGYVGLAKEFRRDYLRAHPDVRALKERTATRPAVEFLKDSVYVLPLG